MLKTATEEKEKSSAYHSDVPETQVGSTLSGPSPGNPVRAHSERRVRPEELAEALRAIGDERHEVFLGALPLDKALEELQVDVSADQIWQKVQERRANKVRLKPGKQRPAHPFLTVAVGVVALIAVGLAMRSFLFAQKEVEQGIRQETTVNAPAQPQRLPNGMVQGEVVDYFTSQLTASGPQLPPGFFWKTPSMRSLASVKDGETFHMNLEAASAMDKMQKGDMFGTSNTPPLTKAQLENIYFIPYHGPGGFEVFRSAGKWYVRGWVTEKVVPKVDPQNIFLQATVPSSAKLAPIMIYSERLESTKRRNKVTKQIEQGPPANMPITIPMDAFVGGSGMKEDHGIFSCEGAVDLAKLGPDAYQPWTKP